MEFTEIVENIQAMSKEQIDQLIAMCPDQLQLDNMPDADNQPQIDDYEKRFAAMQDSIDALNAAQADMIDLKKENERLREDITKFIRAGQSTEPPAPNQPNASAVDALFA